VAENSASRKKERGEEGRAVVKASSGALAYLFMKGEQTLREET